MSLFGLAFGLFWSERWIAFVILSDYLSARVYAAILCHSFWDLEVATDV